MRTSTLTAVALAQLVSAATYDLKSYASGSNFVDSFYFIGGYNSTINGDMWNWWNSGDDFLANVTTAKQKGMLTINASTGNVKLSVDTVPKVDYNMKRFSFRLESRKKYGFGTVFVFDAVHMPYGCGMWPAYWTTGESWPHGGEIDIMEQVNKRTNNQMVFHTDGQCILAPAEGSITGNVVLNDCMHKPTDNAGCATADPRNTSFGSGFNDAQGGIYVTEFAETAISIWFFPRSGIPAGLDSKSNATTIDTATFGPPATQLPNNAGCDLKSQFAEQKIIINTSLCGNFAGEADVLNASAARSRQARAVIRPT
ncbi:concanavalin A-like lectin/glucanase domain-containing protein [Auriculariales sp. MPI-PUGE-AT-0066]|nr:concanavalin A-like lectin/glucanase domain-containing protein [Auriculariales sp. MPI-PUGE-AT-0066]